MQVINVRNVHEALPEAIYQMAGNGIRRDSRNGPVFMAPGPVTTCYSCPQERVLFHPERDANPFFHLFESLWMLAGRNDVAYVSQFVKTMVNFSDDGETFHGAYGFRWRQRWFDQLGLIVQRLKENKDDRRQVIQMYSADDDLAADQNNCKDIPCNLTITVQVSPEGVLDMIVFNRSNDIIWGCYGANAVHFSFLQEYLAAMIGVPIGRYWQISHNWHAYLNTLEPLTHLQEQARNPYTKFYMHFSPYEADEVDVYPLVRNTERFDSELQMFIDEPDAMGYTEPFFRKIAMPMYNAHRAWRHKDYRTAFLNLEGMPEKNDWRIACEQWLQRRKDRRDEKKRREEDDGIVDYD